MENFPNFAFSQKQNPIFHPPKFLMTINHKFNTFPPYFAKTILSPLLLKISYPVFIKFTCFLHTLCVFRFPPSLTMMHLRITQCTYWTPLEPMTLRTRGVDSTNAPPMPHIIFTADMGLLLAAGAVLSQSYADDLQAYVHCSAGQAICAVEAISQAVDTLQAWMSSNRLRLNPTQTQFIWFGTRQQFAKIGLGSLAIKYPHFTFSSSVRDLGVTLDQELTFVRHINLFCRSCYYQLRQLRVVSRSLSPAAASTLVHACVVSRLDYCSAIYEGLPTCRVKCLDRVLRTAARLVGSIPRFGRVFRYMRVVLHWLPYPQRIVYRISALIRRCIEGLAPSYLRELCFSTVTWEYLITLFCPGGVADSRMRTVNRQRRAFSVAGPTAWNGLPVALRLTPVAHSAPFLSRLNDPLFYPGWA